MIIFNVYTNTLHNYNQAYKSAYLSEACSSPLPCSVESLEFSTLLITLIIELSIVCPSPENPASRIVSMISRVACKFLLVNACDCFVTLISCSDTYSILPVNVMKKHDFKTLTLNFKDYFPQKIVINL